MSRLSKTISFVSSLLLLALLIFPAAAQIQQVEGGELGLAQGNNLAEYIIRIVNIFLILVSIAAMVFIITGGLRYIMSGDNESGQEKAKHTILFAVIGLIVVGLAAVIVNFTLFAIGIGG